MGNPSDGFHGKTIALSIANFWAEVTIIESAKLVRCVCSLPPSHPLIPLTFFIACSTIYRILPECTLV